MVCFLCGGVGHRLIISRCQPFKGSGCFTHLEQRLHPGPGSCVLTGDSMSSLGPGCSGQDLSHLPPTPLSQRLSGSLLRSRMTPCFSPLSAPSQLRSLQPISSSVSRGTLGSALWAAPSLCMQMVPSAGDPHPGGLLPYHLPHLTQALPLTPCSTLKNKIMCLLSSCGNRIFDLHCGMPNLQLWHAYS